MCTAGGKKQLESKEETCLATIHLGDVAQLAPYFGPHKVSQPAGQAAQGTHGA